jgi:hypothetical protein
VSRALVLALVTTLVVSALLLTGLSATATAGASGASVSPASTPPAVSWTASEACSSDAHPGLLLAFVVPYCASGAGYAAPPVVMYNVTGATTGIPVWMSAANNSSGEVVVVANNVLTCLFAPRLTTEVLALRVR